MLKFTYTETGLHLEHLSESVENWLTIRVLLSLRANQPMSMEASSASVLLRADLAGIRVLASMARQEEPGAIALTPCDLEFIEVSLQGTWVTSQPDQTEGVFLTTLSPRTELLLANLWRASQAAVSSLRH